MVDGALLVSRRALAGMAAALAVPGVARAQAAGETLTIGTAAEATSLDPHFHEHDPSITVHRQVYEFLVGQGPRMELQPELALSWRPRDPLTWEFRLRPNVLWHDGSPFTAADVLASFRRIPAITNSPGSFAIYVRQITDAVAEDPLTLVLRTAAPFPLMPNYMGAVMIAPAAAEQATTQDFNALRFPGTGPYRAVEYARGQRIVLEANPRHWNGPPAFRRVVIRPVSANGPRVAALLAGEAGLIDQPPPADLPRLRTGPATAVVESVGNRVVFFAFDFHRDNVPGVTAIDGSAIANPFRDRRVREAMSLAINREAVCRVVMEGMAVPANQLVDRGVFGHVPDLPPLTFDPDRARRLLAEAGLPNGFRLTITGTSDRLVNDEKVLQALAQMLSRVGIQAQVDALPSTAFFPRVGRLEFGFFFNSWGAGTSGGLTTMRTLIASFDRDRGFGAQNRGRYSNPEVDRRMWQAFETMDDTAREALLREATAIAMRDHAVLPTHYMSNLWATRANVAYEPRMDGFTLATSARPRA
ncbi:ABC transporter substrate-binding protein [Falsiroseomonas sp. HW251]|uniref:ABC transporter substrate-binding protein n=1 Tax=Falsiroseomonas sp. HW251 TaxID=3390998 RepID=UPI003D320B1F